MTKTTEEYTVIAIYGGGAEAPEAISSLDGTPGYLHMHIIRKDILRKLPTLAAADFQGEHSTIYQWGAPLDKDLAIRKPVVSVGDIIKYGNVGIGSAAIGGEEEKCSFVGGGEVFIIPSPEGVKAFRITKGQGVFPLKLDDHCWTCEVTNDIEALVVPIEKQEIFNRAKLLEILQKAHGQNPDMPFVAQFDALFEKENLAVRSNGLWPDDEVEKRDITLFDAAIEDPVGGHLLGDSESEGDKLNKHKGIAPSRGAQVSLIPQGVVKIAPIQKRLIGLKSDPTQFRSPLLKRELDAALQGSENHRPILINGGGMAGVMTALKLAKVEIPCTIVEQNEALLSGTSGRTPGRVGHGYHYRDLETAKLYLQSSIAFIKENCGDLERKQQFTIGVSEEDPQLDRGLYFIRQDSQVPAAKLLEIYEGIRQEYGRLVELDLSNKVFGEVEEFFQELNLEDYRGQVDIDKMAAVIRTQERLLNWPEFEAHLMKKVESYQQQGLISVITQEEVARIEYDEVTRNRNFKVSMKSGREITASHVVNATWANIEMLDETLFPEAAIEERTNRMKLIASITVPEHARETASMFTAMGPYAMFSNESDGKGKITYAPVTNVLDYVIEELKKEDESTYDFELREIWQEWIDAGEIILGNVILKDEMTSATEAILEQINDEIVLNELREINAKEAAEKRWESLRNIECSLSIPPLYQRWLAEGLNAKEQSFFGRKLLEGVLESYPVLAGAEVIKVDGGIVKSNGEVNIRKTDSQFHQRCDHGLKQRQIGYSDFNGVKLFYCESQSRSAVENIVTDIRLNNSIEKEVANSAAGEQSEYILNSFLRRYANEKTLNRGDFSRLKPSVSGLIPAIDQIEKSAQELVLPKIAVLGAGNVGTFLAAAILNGSPDCDLIIVENSEKRREEIRQFGVGYRAGEAELAISPEGLKVTDSISEPVDILFIATKSYQLTPEFYRTEIEPFLRENSKVVLVQNGYPNPEILAAIGDKAVIMVVNAGFSLDEQGAKSVTNKSQVDLPYGSLSQAIEREELGEEIGKIFLGNPPGLQVRCDENIHEDVMKKAQYACIGAYCAVEAFKSRHPRHQKFTFGNLISSRREEVGRFTSAVLTDGQSQIENNISEIAQEVEMVAGFDLLSSAELQERIKVNANLENSLVTDARNGRKMESGIVGNLLELAQARGLKTPALSQLSVALEVIERDEWNLKSSNVMAVEALYSDRSRV